MYSRIIADLLLQKLLRKVRELDQQGSSSIVYSRIIADLFK